MILLGKQDLQDLLILLGKQDLQKKPLENRGAFLSAKSATCSRR
jgi:hypothetical protein